MNENRPNSNLMVDDSVEIRIKKKKVENNNFIRNNRKNILPFQTQIDRFRNDANNLRATSFT